MRQLVIMGSGETAPTMVTVHQRVLSRVDRGARAVLLDTPYGFQENADDISARALAYFATNVGREVEVASLRSRRLAEDDPLAYETALAAIRAAGWAFAGPGSPSYTLRQWAGTPVPDLLAAKLEHGGAVVFASAAALTIGAVAVPVYEIYKVGEEPRWLEGLDLLGRATGLRCALIPHFDNSEGGNHDTRFCYLGERRLRRLEAELPDEAFVLGVDEHTAIVIDLDTGKASVEGRGTVTIRRDGRSRVLPAGSVVPVEDLGDAGGGGQPPAPAAAGAGSAGDAARAVGHPATAAPVAGPATSLAEETAAAEAAFSAAMAAGDAAGAVRAVLDLEGAIVAWSADTLQSDDLDRARAALRGMVVRLGEVAGPGLADPREVVGPYVELILRLRADARAARRFDEADAVRDGLAGLGVQVRDTPDGVDWSL